MTEEITKTIKSLESNCNKVFFSENRENATDFLLKLIPLKAIVGVGDSATLKQMQVLDLLVKRGNQVINPFTKHFRSSSTVTWEEATRKALLSDIFITSSNAVTKDGKIVNIDNTGNRVAGLIYGPKKAIIVVGRNKIVKNVDEAFYRLKNVIVPYHALKKGFTSPCAISGKCVDCDSPQRLCNVTVVFNKRRIDTTVVIISEDLGLSWDESWPDERISQIKFNYDKVTMVN